LPSVKFGAISPELFTAPFLFFSLYKIDFILTEHAFKIHINPTGFIGPQFLTELINLDFQIRVKDGIFFRDKLKNIGDRPISWVLHPSVCHNFLFKTTF
jgi:hypothetical protein